MIQSLKVYIKEKLASLGLINPALGMKIGSGSKAEHILKNKRSEVGIFVETGTEFGTMIQLVGSHFKKIYSIEYDRELFDKAKELFKNREEVVLLQGDSGVEIQKVLAEVSEPAVFWLDAHGPGKMTVKNPLHCPVEKELQAIVAHPVKGHVVLIDDVRHFDRHTIMVIRKLARIHGFTARVEDGLFIITDTEGRSI
jgi:hypothetical protein